MRVLFIGNSHTFYNDMPHIFREKAAADGVDLDVTMIAHPGWYLDQHVAYPELRFNLLFGRYDYVIAQEHAHPFGPEEKLEHGLRVIADYAKQAGTKLVIYPVWVPKKNPAMQQQMSAAHRRMQAELGCLLAPVDEMWTKYLAEHPDVELYAPDGGHASLVGSTLAATTLWETVKADMGK